MVQHFERSAFLDYIHSSIQYFKITDQVIFVLVTSLTESSFTNKLTCKMKKNFETGKFSSFTLYA